MKINGFAWGMYKDSERGKASISEFEKVAELANEIFISFKYNMQLKRYYDSVKGIENTSVILDDYWNYVVGIQEPPQNTNEAKACVPKTFLNYMRQK